MELLGYTNNTDKLEYDENGFIIPKEMVFFGESFDTTGTTSFKCELLEKTNESYKYNVTIQEENSHGHFVANGTVQIFYDPVSPEEIKEIFVNDIKDGKLRDKCADCFSIYPEYYIHLMHLHKKRLPV